MLDFIEISESISLWVLQYYNFQLFETADCRSRARSLCDIEIIYYKQTGAALVQ